MHTQIYYDDIRPGDPIGPLHKGPMTAMHIMRWSAASENWHRIHYDNPFAVEHENLPGVVVNGSWKQHVLTQLLKDWAGGGGWLWKIGFKFRDKDVSGDTLTAQGEVTRCYEQDGLGCVECSIVLKNQRGIESTLGEATVVLPLRGGRPVPYPFVPPAEQPE